MVHSEKQPHHGHDGAGAGVVGAPVQPHLAVARLEPQHLVQVLSCLDKHAVNEQHWHYPRLWQRRDRWQSRLPEVESRACSKTSTFWMTVRWS